MQKLIIEIDTTNDAFEGSYSEVSRILQGIANSLDHSIYDEDIPTSLHDINGNLVGHLYISA